MNWESIRAFCALMRGGGLNAASRRLNVSAATISRRIHKLEEELESTLFSRTASGYQPTAAARDLYESARAMDAAALELERTFSGLSSRSGNIVRIAAGNWLSRLIARNLGRMVEEVAPIEIEILNSYEVASLSADDADISLRNRRPNRGRFVTRRHRGQPFAVYCSENYLRQNPDAEDAELWPKFRWIGFVEHFAHLPSAIWVRKKIGREPDIRCSQAINVLDATIGSAGLAPLPTFVGDEYSQLKRLAPDTALETDGFWMVVHEDVYKRPTVQRVLKALSGILTDA